MSATNHTQNYDLSQFVGGDIPSWLNDYNGDMSKIDAAIASVAQGSGDVAADVASLKSRMTSAEADIDAAESNISTLQSTTSTQGAAITQNANNITTTNNNVSALDTRVTALENATGLDLDISAHVGNATITSGSVGTPNGKIKYQLNADGSIGKIYGYITTNGTFAQGDNVIASFSISDLPDISAAKEKIMGGTATFNSDTTAYGVTMEVKLRFNVNKTVDLIVVNPVASRNAFAVVTLPPCLLFMNIDDASDI